MQVSATVYSQTTKLSLNMQSRQVVDVLKEIEDKSDFRFFFQREQVDVTRKVDVNVTDRSVEAILDELFKDQGVNYKVMPDNLIIITPGSSQSDNPSNSQQQKSVTGKVTDTAGVPLPGVTVSIKGTTNGTITDSNGNYNLLSLPDNAILSISFVGMRSREIQISGKSQINVSLSEDVIKLDEVVTIGYGTVKKSNLTSSISKITSDAIQNRPDGGLG